jgi:hypothetical protein
LLALAFAVVFLGSGYMLLALVEHSWWKPVVVIAAGMVVGHLAARVRRGCRPAPTNRRPDADAAARE